MKKNPIIRDVIDESLSGIHFNAKDMRSVMRAVRRNEEHCAPARPKRRPRLDLVFSMALVLMIALPVSVFTLHARSAKTTAFVAAPGLSAQGERTTPVPFRNADKPTPLPQATFAPQATLAPQATFAPQETSLPQATLVPGLLSEHEAIQIARACFELQCDTTVFTFEEYTVSTALVADDSSVPYYRVTMQSVYDNGCAFTILVSAEDGAVLKYSAPKLATVPAYLRVDSPEVQTWFDKNGEYLFTWPQDVQAEFSRRYEGYALRAWVNGEITAEQAQQIALASARDTFAQLGVPCSSPCAYPMLYAERASSDGVARYTVRCFAEPITDELPTPCVIVTLEAGSGRVESVRTEQDGNSGLS